MLQGKCDSHLVCKLSLTNCALLNVYRLSALELLPEDEDMSLAEIDAMLDANCESNSKVDAEADSESESEGDSDSDSDSDSEGG